MLRFHTAQANASISTRKRKNFALCACVMLVSLVKTRLKKEQDWILNPKESENGLCISFHMITLRLLRVRFFSKIEDWILESETDQSKISRILVRQRNRRTHSGNGFTLIHHDLFRIQESNLRFSKRNALLAALV